MKTYLVGGAVRNQLLDLPVHEKDYVVVGATPEEMTAQGFRPVGRDFPVFLHPKTHAEYALARTEKKIARGHQGFQFYTDPKVTLEEDLKRRDLTINAIAQDETTGQLIDPFQGQIDLKKRVLRHVSEAFSEDPLRILRVARFRAYLGSFEFTIASETLALMQKMVQENALSELSDERIWQELYRALQTDFPALFFETLLQIGATPALFAAPPSIHFGTASIDPDRAALIRFAVVCFDAPYKHTAPNEFADLAKLVQEKTRTGFSFINLSIEEKVEFLRSLDYLRRPERFGNWLLASTALFPNFPAEVLESAADRLRTLDRQKIAANCKNPNEIAAAIMAAECQSLK